MSGGNWDGMRFHQQFTCALKIYLCVRDYNIGIMTDREAEFKETFERQLPEYAKMCRGDEHVLIMHQDSFATDYRPEELASLGMAIKYAGLMGKEVRVIGRNGETLKPALAGLRSR
jgi:hypothetical protein